MAKDHTIIHRYSPKKNQSSAYCLDCTFASGWRPQGEAMTAAMKHKKEKGGKIISNATDEP